MELQVKYNQSLMPTDHENQEEKNYRLGMNFAYYDVLDLIEAQLNAFGLNFVNIGKITPILKKMDE